MDNFLAIAHWLLIPIFLFLRLWLIFYRPTRQRIWIQSVSSITLIALLSLSLYSWIVFNNHSLEQAIRTLDSNDDGVADRREDAGELARLVKTSFNGAGQLFALVVIPALMLIVEFLVTSCLLLWPNRGRK
jgi:hypothetical protein